MLQKNKLVEIYRNSKAISDQDGVFLDKATVNDILSKLISIGPFYNYTLDFSQLPQIVMEHKNQKIYDFYGIEPKEFNLEVLLSRIHPDDINFVKKCESVIIKAINNIYYKDLTNFKVSYCFKAKDKNGVYKLIHHQSIIIKVDNNNKLTHCLNIHTDISHITTTNSRKISFFGFNGLPSFINLDPHNDSLFETNSLIHYTSKELEIIRYISEGLNNAEISEKMFISEHTVKTHRKNILSKSEYKNFTELIISFVRQGII